MKIITEYAKSRLKSEKQVAVFLGVAVATALLTVIVLFFAVGYYSMTHGFGWTMKDVIRNLIQSFVSITFGVILFVALLYNLFKISTQKRLKELGLLKTLGASPKDIKNVLRLEALYKSILPVILGMLLGTVLTFFIVKLIYFFNASSASFKNLDGNFSFFNIEFKFNPLAYILIFALSVLTVFISVSLSARKASKYSPIQMLVEQVDKKQKKMKLAKNYEKELFKNHKKFFTPVSRIIIVSYVILFIGLTFVSFANIYSWYEYTESDCNFVAEFNVSEKDNTVLDFFQK